MRGIPVKFRTIFFLVVILPTIFLSTIPYYQYQRKFSWKYVINYHVDKYPGLKPQDIYKVIYQSVMGPYHLGKCRNTIYNSLKSEMKEISPEPDLDLREVIAPDRKYTRIDLRRFKSERGDLHLLSEIIYQSSEKSDKNQLIAALEQVNELIKDNKIDYNMEDWTNYYQQVKKNDYPVPHHSNYYIEFYLPSYRVVNTSIWEKERGEIFN